MNIMDIDGKDTVRNILSWGILMIVVVLMYGLKPAANVYESSMYLPLVTNRSAIDNNKVSVLGGSNYFFYKKIGYITIMTPAADDLKNIKLKVIEQAKTIAANAGAEVLYVEGSYSSVWFDSGKRVFRLQAVAMSQS